MNNPNIRKIGIVQPDPELRQVISDTLNDCGFDPIDLGSDESALSELYKNRTLQGLVVDFSLQEMSGYIFCKKIRSEPISLRVPIVITAHPSHVDNTWIQPLKPSDVLIHPFVKWVAQIVFAEVFGENFIASHILGEEMIEDIRASSPIAADIPQTLHPRLKSSPLMEGDITMMSVIQVLRYLESGSKNGQLFVSNETSTAIITLQNGRIPLATWADASSIVNILRTLTDHQLISSTVICHLAKIPFDGMSLDNIREHLSISKDSWTFALSNLTRGVLSQVIHFKRGRFWFISDQESNVSKKYITITPFIFEQLRLVRTWYQMHEWINPNQFVSSATPLVRGLESQLTPIELNVLDCAKQPIRISDILTQTQSSMDVLNAIYRLVRIDALLVLQEDHVKNNKVFHV